MCKSVMYPHVLVWYVHAGFMRHTPCHSELRGGQEIIQLPTNTRGEDMLHEQGMSNDARSGMGWDDVVSCCQIVRCRIMSSDVLGCSDVMYVRVPQDGM